MAIELLDMKKNAIDIQKLFFDHIPKKDTERFIGPCISYDFTFFLSFFLPFFLSIFLSYFLSFFFAISLLFLFTFFHSLLHSFLSFLMSFFLSFFSFSIISCLNHLGDSQFKDFSRSHFEEVTGVLRELVLYTTPKVRGLDETLEYLRLAVSAKLLSCSQLQVC